jgi:RNA polymerase sigma-70 factor (ECF subfamily)
MFEDELIPGYEVAAKAASESRESSRPGSPEASLLEREVIAFFDQYRDRLLRYLVAIGLSVPDGEEIVQEVFLALFRHLRAGKPRHNLRAWIFQVAHNLALRQRGAAQRSQQNLVPFAASNAEDVLIDHAPNPEARLAGKQRFARLSAVLQVLPEQDRRCLFLRAEGLTYREIADVLGVSLGAVPLSLARSLARLSRADER